MTKLNTQLFYASDDSYEANRTHSEDLDRELGVAVEAIEVGLLEIAKSKLPDGDHKKWGQAIHEGNQTWVGLSHQTLQTPYGELREICELLNPQDSTTVVDLGAGYGRLGLILGSFFPEVNFIGHEYVPERVREGQRILELYKCQKAQLLQKNLTSPDYQLPLAEYYFIYDYGTVPHLRRTLKQLEVISEKKNFKVIARGKGVRSLIQYEFPWLSQVYAAIHREQYSIYSMSQNL